ncbi:MAG: hypothetical protein K2G70_02720, partial [Turicibacter sp.]|nr:hypothetical protein [Turicibacter sp.]
GLNGVAELIKNSGQDLIMNPVTWIVIMIVAIGIYGLYDVSDKVKQNGLGSVLRQLVQTILDTTGDLINALRSLTGFIGVLRQLLFGQLNEKTLFILINYAIVFLSMASFTTTFNGLSSLVSFPLAAFISFGIQVSILIYTTRIQNLKEGNAKDDNKKMSRSYFLNQISGELIGVREETISFERDDKKSKVVEEAENSIEKYKKTGKKKKRGKKEGNGLKIIFKGLGWFILLTASVLLSSSFSYVFMFDKFIKEQLFFDDHFRAITVAHEISNEYSEDISIYVSDITDVLSQYNDKVEEWLNLREDNPSIQQDELEDLRNKITECDAEIRAQELIRARVEMTTPEYEVANLAINRLEAEKAEYERELNEKSDTLGRTPEYQNRWRAYESIQLLTEFYGNPVYLIEGNIEDVRKSFSDLRMAEANYRMNAEESENIQFDDDMARQIEKVFESYITLNEFFSSQNKYGVDFSDVSNVFGEIEYSEDMTKETYQENTNAILTEMLEIMNEVPILSDLQNVWTGERIIAPNQLNYLDSIYDLYRDNSGQSESLERAFKKLFGANKEKILLSIELFLIALMIDWSIVWLTLLRGRKRYLSDTADMRRLIGILFIDDSMNHEEERRSREQGFSMAIGIVSGVLVYIIYKIGGNNQIIDWETDIFVFLFCILIGLAVALLTYKLFYKVRTKKQNWEDETLYLRWKEIWTSSIGSEKELEKRIYEFRNGRVPSTEIVLGENDIKSITRLWQGEEKREADKKPLFIKYFYKNVVSLMESLEMRKCYKATIIRTMKKKKLSKVDYISETIMLPCLSEEKVKEFKMKTEFSLLLSRKLVFFDYIDSAEQEGHYILGERFWNLLYDAVLIRVVGGRLNEWDIEEEMQDYGEDEEDY